jgi:hypothetical protein
MLMVDTHRLPHIDKLHPSQVSEVLHFVQILVGDKTLKWLRRVTDCVATLVRH